MCIQEVNNESDDDGAILGGIYVKYELHIAHGLEYMRTSNIEMMQKTVRNCLLVE